MGAPVATFAAVSVGAGAVGGVAPVVAYLGLEQCQTAQVMSLFNMNTPESFVGYSQGYKITKLDMNFDDNMDAQNSVDDGARRNLYTGHVSLSNVGFKHGSFLVNYCYFFALVGALILVHIILTIVIHQN